MDTFDRSKLEDIRAFIFSEHADGKISDDTAKELIRLIDYFLTPRKVGE